MNSPEEIIPTDPLSAFSKKPTTSGPGYFVEGATSPYAEEFARPNSEFFEDRQRGEDVQSYIQRRAAERPDLLEKLLKYGVDPEYPLDPGWEERTGHRPKRVGNGVIKLVRGLLNNGQ